MKFSHIFVKQNTEHSFSSFSSFSYFSAFLFISLSLSFPAALLCPPVFYIPSILPLLSLTKCLNPYKKCLNPATKMSEHCRLTGIVLCFSCFFISFFSLSCWLGGHIDAPANMTYIITCHPCNVTLSQMK